MVESLGATDSSATTESALLLIMGNSGRSANLAASSAICSEESWSSGLESEPTVAVGLLSVLVLIVWLADRFETINVATINNSKMFPLISPHLIYLRFVLLSSRDERLGRAVS